MTNEEIFNKNTNIAYKIANRYKLYYPDEYEDIKQVALMGLWKAILDYNHVNALTTYAYIVIPHEINMYLRHVKRHIEHDISINTPIHESSSNCLMTIEDVLEDNTNYIDILLNEINFDNIVNKMEVTEFERKILNLRISGITQREVAKIYKLSQAQICRIEKRIGKKNHKRINYI